MILFNSLLRLARQRLLGKVIAPAIGQALRARGPVDVFGVDAQALAMGDDCHMRHQAATLLRIRMPVLGSASFSEGGPPGSQGSPAASME